MRERRETLLQDFGSCEANMLSGDGGAFLFSGGKQGATRKVARPTK